MDVPIGFLCYNDYSTQGHIVYVMTRDRLPEEGKLLNAKDSGGMIHQLRYKHKLWWTHDYGMYVYFTPVSWSYAAKRAH